MLVAELVAAAGVACVRAGGAQRVLVVLCGGWLVLVACIEPTDV